MASIFEDVDTTKELIERLNRTLDSDLSTVKESDELIIRSILCVAAELNEMNRLTREAYVKDTGRYL